MSTDLHLIHTELPKLRVSAVKMEQDPSSDQTYDDQISSIIVTQQPNQTENENQTKNENENENENDDTVGADDETYRTPTSKESRIPEILNCPPAPRKPKALVSCKRKLIDEFFEVTNKEDMDAFFRSNFPKRSCPCT